MTFQVDVEQTGPFHGGPVADDPDVEQLLHDLVALTALIRTRFTHRPAGHMCALYDEVAEPNRPRVVDRGEQRSERRAAQQGVALVQRLDREHAVDKESINVYAVSQGGAGFHVEQSPAHGKQHALTLADGRASRPACVPARGSLSRQPNDSSRRPADLIK
ncbi:hypothetical protein [Dactylosporangium sp. NPDC051484]|uniref:hypothetical protein n=1 Tax=Dactylosporangium sp. NPDC051484 TaxID=3154942 RepID=UPI00344D4912